MLKNYFKKLSLLLVAILIIAMFGACGQVDKKDTAENTTKAQTAIQTETKAEADGKGISKYAPIEGKKYTINWTGWQASPLSEDPTMIKYWNDKLGVDIKVINLEKDKIVELLSLKLASGDIPDVIHTVGFNVLQKYHDDGVLTGVPLDVYAKYAPNIVRHVESDSPGAFKYASYDGLVYGIPTIGYDNRFRRPIVWRKDWLENVGISKTPETIDEFEQAFYKFANEDPNKDNKKDTYALSASGFMGIFGAFGYIPSYADPRNELPAMWQERDGKLVYSSIQPEVKKALVLLSKWYKDGLIDPEFITGENKGAPWQVCHAFVNGAIGFTSHGYYFSWAEQNEETSRNLIELGKVEPNAKLVFSNPPVGPEGKSGVIKGNTVSGGFKAFGIQLEKEPDKLGKILQVIDTINSTYENFLTSRAGIQGVHWDYVDGKLTPKEKWGDPVEMAKNGGHVVMQVLTPFEYMGKYLKLRSDWAIGKGYLENGIETQLLTSLPSESKYKTELDKIEDETFIAIITGDKSVDYFDEFVSKWRSSGGGQLEKEINEWYSSLK